MDALVDAIVKIVFEAGLEVGTNKKVPKPIRIIIALSIVLFSILGVAVLMWFGIKYLSKSLAIGVLLISISIVVLILFMIAYIKIFLKSKNK